jgi:uncharacterized protein (DUF885 family)
MREPALQIITAAIAVSLVLSACEQPVKTPAVSDIADRYYAFALATTPEIAYFSGVELERHDGMEDISPAARAAAAAKVDDILTELQAIDADTLVGTADWITHAYLLQELQSQVATRVCRTELWNVSQMDGWHLGYSQVAQLQPVGTPELRQQSLARWSILPAYIEQNIANLQEGLALGYSAPKAAVARVIDQVDGLLALDIEQSPFFSPAVRDVDAEFVAATRGLVSNKIYPALQRYRDFLAGPYMDDAREELSVTANPDGLDCYEASIRSYTTLDRSGKKVFELGQATVAANKAAVVEMGRSAYELTDFVAIMDRVTNDTSGLFVDKEQLLQFSNDMVQRAEEEMPNWVGTMPTQPVIVVPFAEHEEGTGRSAHYRPGSEERPGEYRIPLHKPQEQSRSDAETVAFHEAWPGHHLQVAIGQSMEGLHPITQILWFSGPGEGWARYSEALAEEMGLYVTVTGPIKRRAWPARGMVVDPGIHLFGWSREQAKEFMLESGRFPESQGDEMVDRIAVLPGQLTAYDSGGLEILALRREAEGVMGDDFDIRQFHDRILENGTIPLGTLRQHIEAWIADYESAQ